MKRTSARYAPSSPLRRPVSSRVSDAPLYSVFSGGVHYAGTFLMPALPELPTGAGPVWPITALGDWPTDPHMWPCALAPATPVQGCWVSRPSTSTSPEAVPGPLRQDSRLRPLRGRVRDHAGRADGEAPDLPGQGRLVRLQPGRQPRPAPG